MTKLWLKHVCLFYSANSKVGGGRSGLSKALVTMCDMAHKSLYFDEKLES